MPDRPCLFVLGSFVVACSARVGRFPQSGESAIAENFVVEAGGKGFNLAVGAHRLGANVYSIFAVGDDVFSQTAAPAFTKAGLTPTRLVACPGSTGSGIGFIDATGETCLAVYPGANLAMTGKDVESVAQEVSAAQIVLAQFEIGDEPIETAFALARQASALTILNPSPFRMPSAALLRDTSILVVNEVEAMGLAAALGETAIFAGPGVAPSFAEAVMTRGPETLVVTRGRRGAVAFRRGLPPIVQPVFSVETLDSLGAGDAFLAAFAVGLGEHLSFEACLRQAAAAGALATLCPGVFDALPQGENLRAFLVERHDEAQPQDT